MSNLGIYKKSCRVPIGGMLIGFTSILAAGCTITPGLRNDIDRGNVDVPGVEVVELTADVLLKELQATRNAETQVSASLQDGAGTPYQYQLGIGDVVRVVIWEHPELNNPSGQSQGDAASSGRLIEPDGTLFFPYVGKIAAAGLTSAELRERIARPLSRFIRDPQVDVRVTEFRSQRIYVTGEVANPGPLPLGDIAVSPLDAIAQKGGFTELSNRQHVTLVRGGVATDIRNDDPVDGGSLATLRLRNGDRLHVLDNLDDKIFLLGEFTAQKTIMPGRGKVSLADALAQGGGVAALGGNPAAVFIFRRRGGQETDAAPTTAEALLPRVYALDLTRAESLLLAERFSLQSRDVVYIAATDFSKYNRVIGQLLPTISSVFQVDRLVSGR